MSLIYLHPGEERPQQKENDHQQRGAVTLLESRKKDELTTARGWISSSLEALESPSKPWEREQLLIQIQLQKKGLRDQIRVKLQLLVDNK